MVDCRFLVEAFICGVWAKSEEKLYQRNFKHKQCKMFPQNRKVFKKGGITLLTYLVCIYIHHRVLYLYKKEQKVDFV